MGRGFTLKKTIGLGDAIQFTSVPENFYKTFRRTIVDMNHHWVFDHNPFVVRDPITKPSEVIELWDYFSKPPPVPPNREQKVYLSMAERHAGVFGAQVFLNRPRLYRFEDYPFKKREMILLHTHGKSHGEMPRHVIGHVLKKYKGMPLFHIGLPTDPYIGIPKIETPNIWDLVKLISECKMLIDVDSGPSWIAACYPDVIIKKVRTKPTLDQLKNWVPLEIRNIHSYWDDRVAQIHNTSDDDVGFTQSYRRI